MPVKTLISVAFGIREGQIVGGPRWVNSDRFDIDAKSDVPLTPGTLRPYLGQLLAERFKLETHSETRELPVYALVLARDDGQLGPELRRPDTDYCAEAVARQQNGQQRNPVGQPSRCVMRGGPGVLTARSMRLGSVAARLSDALDRVVIDRTGFDGVFDVDLKWAPDQLGPRPGVPPASTVDPNGPSIFSALQEQLGLKLQPTRGPVDVVVIDHVELPTPD